MDKNISSYPYINGNMFMLMSDWHFTNPYPVIGIEKYIKNIDLQNINDGDLIYIKRDNVDEFLIKYLPNIKNKIKLISHNGDMSITDYHSSLLNDNIIEWWCVNNESSDIRIKSLPIGIQNKNLYFEGNPQGDNLIIDEIKLEKVEKVNDVLLTFNINTNRSHREYVYNYFKDLKFVNERRYNNDDRKNKEFIKNYLLDIKRHKFVICPWGNGYDCHRNWEVLYMGSIPIIKKHKSLNYYNDLPVWLVDDWTEVNEETISYKYIEIINKNYNIDKLYYDYWKNLIKNN